MTLDEYVSHYTDTKSMLLFLAVAFLGALLSVLIVAISARISAKGRDALEIKRNTYERTHNYVQRYYEMIFSATSILSFLAIYYLIDRFLTDGKARDFWDSYSDMILLLMIIISCVVNNYLDYMLIPLKKISKEEKASVRIMGMLYIFMIFFYIKFIYENDNYDGFIMYFLGLMIGRFVYFDASFEDFCMTVGTAMKNLPLLILGLSYTGLMCFYGFKSGYLLTSNGVLVSTFFAHMFMVVAVFVVHHSHILSLFVRKPKTGGRK